MKKILFLCILLGLGLFLTSCTPAAQYEYEYEDDWELHSLGAHLADCILPLSLGPGVFVGTDSGGRQGDVAIEITVSIGGVITAIQVTQSNETPQYADPAFEHLISSLIATQRPQDVNAYARATWSSRAFLNAAWDALEQSIAIGPGGG